MRAPPPLSTGFQDSAGLAGFPFPAQAPGRRDLKGNPVHPDNPVILSKKTWGQTPHPHLFGGGERTNPEAAGTQRPTRPLRRTIGSRAERSKRKSVPILGGSPAHCAKRYCGLRVRPRLRVFSPLLSLLGVLERTQDAGRHRLCSAKRHKARFLVGPSACRLVVLRHFLAVRTVGRDLRARRFRTILFGGPPGGRSLPHKSRNCNEIG